MTGSGQSVSQSESVSQSVNILNLSYLFSGADALDTAIRDVLESSTSIHKASKKYGLPYSTLRDHVQLKKQGGPKPHDLPRMSTLGLKHKTVFSSNQEREMKDYIRQAAEIAMGMTGDEVRSFAYKCGIYFNVEMPVSWDKDMKAGKKWLKLYLKRNDLTYRKAELTSYNRLLGWNQEATNAFMANLGELYERYKFKPTRIFAGDESGVTTVADSPKIVTPCGAKHVISPAAAERGQLVTVMAAASATGMAIPPMFIFPRKTYKDMWVQAGPPGCIGHSSASGWQDADGFLKFLQHVQSVTNAIPGNEILFIMDNFFAHLDPEVLNYAKSHGIVLLTTPAHTTHKLMPLDLTVFKSFKSFIVRESLAWKKSHDKKIDIYDIPAIAGAEWVQSFNPPNIISGFEKAGIFPYAPHKFEHEFATSQFDARETIESPSHLTPAATLRPLPSVAQSSNVIKAQDPAAQETMQIQNRSSKTKHPAFSEDSYVTETEPTGDDGPKTKSSTTPESLLSLLTAKQVSVWRNTGETLDQFLKSHGLVKIPIPGDGHCMVSSVSLSLRSSGIAMDDKFEVIRRLREEVSMNVKHYASLSDSLDEDLQAYVNERVYVSDTADLFLTALANSYGHTITLLIVSPESQAVSIVNLEPRRDRAMAIKRTLFLIRSGVGAATHYDAVANLADVYMAVNADMTPEISQDISPLPEQSSSSNKQTQPSPGASLLQTIPLPKAATSRKRNARRTMMTSQILTDTQVKCKIERAAEEKKKETRETGGKWEETKESWCSEKES